MSAHFPLILMWFDGDDDDDRKNTPSSESEGGPEAGNYDLPDSIGTRIGEHETLPKEDQR